MTQLTLLTLIRIRCEDLDKVMPWGPDMDPWRWAAHFTAGVLSY